MSPSSAAVRWFVVVATDQGASTSALAEGDVAWVGRSPAARIRLDDASVEPEHLLLTPAGDVLALDARAPVLVNEVQVRGVSHARAGDVVRVGGATLLLQRGEPLSRSTPLLGFEAFVAVLAEALADPALREGVLTIARVPGANLEGLSALIPDATSPAARRGAFALDAVAVWVPYGGASPRRNALPERDERFSAGVARFPQNGRTAHALLAAALSRMAADEATGALEPVISDPTMVALMSVLEGFLRGGRSVTLFGEPGSGKKTWALSALRHAELRAVPIEPRAGLELLEERREGADAWLYLDRPDLLPAPLQEFLVRALSAEGAPSFVASLPADPMDLAAAGVLDRQLAATLSRAVLRVPALRERTGDVAPLAEAILERARRQWHRPVVTVGAAAREALLRHDFPGNVPELEVALMRAALIAPSDEVRPADLPPEIAAHASAEGRNVRGALKTVERDAYLDALTRTRWNVTEAARVLGLPRRTLVYRMRKLGLRRPRREG